MKHSVLTPADADDALDTPRIMELVSTHSARPRYTFMVLELIARASDTRGRAGPWVQEGGAPVPIREWLCDAMVPSAARHHRRQALAAQVRDTLSATGTLPRDPNQAQATIASEIKERVRASGMTAVSRAVSELVRAGLLKRHYQGYRVDHENRGAQRLAVYTVQPSVLAILGASAALV